MHPIVFREYERILVERGAGEAVLEIGAIPNRKSLLNAKALGGATRKVGLNLDGPYAYRDFEILKGNANAMVFFADGEFDTVLCNAVLEHDPFFWKAVAEIQRVTRSGGLVALGAPGFGGNPLKQGVLKLVGRRGRWARRVTRSINVLLTVTATIAQHDRPADYYRFSPQAFRDVLLAGLNDVEVRALMWPPRLIGVGVKP